MIKEYLRCIQFTVMANLHLALKKRDLFNSYFAEQGTFLVNNSKLLSVLIVHTESILESFQFSTDHSGENIKKPTPSNSHRHDTISIRMLKVCGNFIWQPLETIFKDCLKEVIFPVE